MNKFLSNIKVRCIKEAASRRICVGKTYIASFVEGSNTYTVLDETNRYNLYSSKLFEIESDKFYIPIDGDIVG